MSDYLENYNDDWKVQLRQEIIRGLIGSPSEQKDAYTQVGYYYKCIAPASIYKYFREDQRSIVAVKENKLWYSVPCKFNDVFDCDILIDEKAILNSVLKPFPDKRGVRPGRPVWKEVQKQIAKEIPSLRTTLDGLKTKTGIACFSESDDSILMWSHYANNHRGICVEYDLMKINEQLGFSPVPVVYGGERVRFGTIAPDKYEAESKRVLIESLTSKSQEWDYEREWRIIRDDGACGSKWDPDKNGALLEMIRPISIILGCMTNPELEEEVKAHCIKERINLYKMRKSNEQYKLEKEAVLLF